ncbi:MAG: queuosine biosynthesis protein QueC [Candidatus Frackibacter sp. T328-2]|nr:MAG: queuosine biosynthesis protein QueC [Candidatus Frackibacter sp. T328-2]
MTKRAIVLSSGGLDSTTCLSIALDEGYEVYPLTFLYGQKHSKEVEQAKLVRSELGIPEDNHLFARIDNIGHSALTSDEIEIPDGEGEGIPDTYVPARNILFLSYAVSLAEGIDAEVVYIGVSSIDYSGYPDCRPEFINAYQQVINVGTKAGVEGNPIEIKTPLIDKTKAETIEIGLKLDAPYYLTTTCYRGDEKACGSCPACEIRLKAFAKVGVEDPIEYKI